MKAGTDATHPVPAFFILLQINFHHEEPAQMTPMQTEENDTRKRSRILLLVALLGLAAFMYVSIMYKIIKFGP